MAIIDFFDRGWRQSPQATAYVMGDRTWTYEEAGAQSCRIAHRLLDRGYAHEANAAVLAPNDVASWLCVLGIWRAGLAWVPLNPTRPPEDTRNLIDTFECEIVFFHESLTAMVEELKPLLARVNEWVSVAEVEVWAGDFPPTPPSVPYQPNDVVAVASTGGTTGLPKGVMNTHRSLAVTVAHLMLAYQYRADERPVNLAAAPMTHGTGILSLPVTARGGTVVVIPRPEPTAVLDAIEAHGVTELFLPPTVVYRLLEVEGVAERSLPSLKYLMYAAAPMSLDKLRRALEVFGPVMMECYGQVEAFAAISYFRPEEHYVDGEVAPDSRLASCGRPYPLISVEIRDGEDRPVAGWRAGRDLRARRPGDEGLLQRPRPDRRDGHRRLAPHG